MADTKSALERLLNIDFSSDPRRARFDLPGTDNPDYLAGKPSVPLGRLEVDREIAYDMVVNRIYREGATPRDLHHDQMINRDPSINEVKKWARERLLPGKWMQTTPNGLLITPEGYVLGGQHRLCGMLYAFIIASREGLPIGTFSIPVTGNVAWDHFSTDDVLLTRQAYQFMQHYSDPRRAVTTLRHLAPMLVGEEKLKLFEERADINELRALEKLFPEMGSGWFEEVETAKRRTGIPSKILLAHMIAAYRAGASYAKVQEFLNPLLHPEMILPPSDARDRLRAAAYSMRNNRLRNNVKKLNKRDEVVYTNLIRYALRNFLEGKTLDRMSASGEGLAEVWHAAQLQQWYKEATA